MSDYIGDTASVADAIVAPERDENKTPTQHTSVAEKFGNASMQIFMKQFADSRAMVPRDLDSVLAEQQQEHVEQFQNRLSATLKDNLTTVYSELLDNKSRSPKIMDAVENMQSVLRQSSFTTREVSDALNKTMMSVRKAADVHMQGQAARSEMTR